jgi:uncharacterized membrane protein
VIWLLRNNRFLYNAKYLLHNYFLTGLLATIPLLILLLIYYYIEESDRLQVKSISHSVLQFFLTPLFLFFSIKKLGGLNQLMTVDLIILLLLCLIAIDFSGHIRRGSSQILRRIEPEHEIHRDLYSRRKELQQWGIITWATVILVTLISADIFKRS